MEGTRPVTGFIEGTDVLVYDGLRSDPFRNFIELRKPGHAPLNEFWRSLIECEAPRRCKLDWVKN
jgi:hypothetical protein